MKLSLLHKHLKSLFPNTTELRRFLRSVKKLPQPGNTQEGKVPEDYGLFLKDGNWNLLYYIREEEQFHTRMLSLKTQDIYLSRAVRDSLMEATGLKTDKPSFFGMRGARWAAANPVAFDGVRVVVYVRGPERGRRFTSTGDPSAIQKALQWRTGAAQSYLKRHSPPCSATEKK